MASIAWLIAVAAPVLGASAPSDSFDQWVHEYGKHYPTEAARESARAAFIANAEVLEDLRRAEDGGAEYGHTRFGDLHPIDFRRSHLPRDMDAEEGLRGGEPLDAAAPPAEAPESFDWRASGAVTMVKDQASCGSCWAESAVSNIESVWYLANKASMGGPVALSVEQVIECDVHDYACYGGYPKGAYKYTIEHGGLAADADYPYKVNGHVICLANQTYNETCGDGICEDPPLTNYCDMTCSDRAHKAVAKISSWVALPNNEDQIAAYLVAHGPVSVGMDASGTFGAIFPWLQFYKHGVANPGRCSSTIDHGVLLVGYGVEGSRKYWTIKNSWGTKWGEDGYFRLIRGLSKCGISTMASSAIVSSAHLKDAIVI